METQRSKLVTSTPVAWSDGTLFDGYLFIGLNPPLSGANVLPSIAKSDTVDRQQVPLVYPIPIKNGVINDTARLYYTSSLQPPNTRYAAQVFDINRNAIGSMGSLFTVTGETTTITIPVLTVPTTPVTPSVTPES